MDITSYHSELHKTLTKLFLVSRAKKTQIQTLFKYIKLNVVKTDFKHTVTSAKNKMIKFHQAIEAVAGERLV